MYSTVRIQVQLIQYPGTTGMAHIDIQHYTYIYSTVRIYIALYVYRCS